MHLGCSRGEGMDVAIQLRPERVHCQQRVSIGVLLGFLRLNASFELGDLRALHLQLRSKLAILKLQRLQLLLDLRLLCFGGH